MHEATAAAAAETLEESVLAHLHQVLLGPEGPDVVTAGQIYDVVVTGGAVRILLDPERVDEASQQALADTITPLVEGIPGVERAVVKPRPARIALRDALPGIRYVVGVHSGKGGVGKSTVTANLAVELARQGWRVGLLDADVYGPSIPTLFGLRGRAMSDDAEHIIPFEAHGVKLMSLGFLLPENQALIWRGSLVDEGLPQLINDVEWGELDLLLVDLPPGTSDVHLALARQVALTGVITVTAPGQVSVDDVRRGMEMFADVMVPSLGIIENMAAVTCRRCGESRSVFGFGGGSELAGELGVPLLATLPFLPEVCADTDQGVPSVVSDPDSPVAARLIDVATQLAERLERHARSQQGDDDE
ncbi:MAG: iron-sulfur cluster carrier protein ApbC [Gammaproteobacteria bacterium]